jgi:hypothetical protein
LASAAVRAARLVVDGYLLVVEERAGDFLELAIVFQAFAETEDGDFFSFLSSIVPQKHGGCHPFLRYSQSPPADVYAKNNY